MHCLWPIRAFSHKHKAWWRQDLTDLNLQHVSCTRADLLFLGVRTLSEISHKCLDASSKSAHSSPSWPVCFTHPSWTKSFHWVHMHSLVHPIKRRMQYCVLLLRTWWYYRNVHTVLTLIILRTVGRPSSWTVFWAIWNYLIKKFVGEVPVINETPMKQEPSIMTFGTCVDCYCETTRLSAWQATSRRSRRFLEQIV